MSFPRYPEYKDSGVEWLGAIPAHWECVRIATLFREVNESGNDDLPILSVSIHDGVSDKELDADETERKVSRSDDRSKYKSVAPGDLTYNMMRAWQGGFGTVAVHGMVSPAYVVARPTREFSTSNVEMLLRTPMAVSEMKRHSRGITDFRLRLYWEDFKCIGVALPPRSEQLNIATFLGQETAKIDALVAEQEKLIALLKEKRQAVISHSVTKGLDTKSPKKDSGIEWLGEIPAPWDCVPMKYLVRLQSGGTPSKERRDYWDGDVSWASAKDMKVDCLFDTEDHITEYAVEDGAAALVPSGAVVVVVRGMILARTFPVALTMRDMAINQDLKAVRCGERLRPEFLAWYLRGTSDESLCRLDEAGHGTKALRMDAWTSLELALPPLEEQTAIVEFISDATKRFDNLIAEADSAIGLLKERRSALISATVTGKIDVRGLVASTSVSPEVTCA